MCLTSYQYILYIDRFGEFPRLIDSKFYNIQVSAINYFASSICKNFPLQKVNILPTSLHKNRSVSDVQGFSKMAKPVLAIGSMTSDQALAIYFIKFCPHFALKKHTLEGVKVFTDSSSIVMVWTCHLCYKVSVLRLLWVRFEEEFPILTSQNPCFL